MPSIPDPKLELFARFVAEGKSHKEAAIAAGYSPKSASQTGSRLQKNTKICERIAELQECAAKLSIQRVILSKDWVLEKLKLNVERALQEVEVLDSKGQKTGEFQYEGNVANKGLELLGRHLGMFEKVDPVDSNAPRPMVLIGLPDGETVESKPLNADRLKAAGKLLPVQ